MKIDIAKRRRVMERSRLLGHCICDPHRPCPCDVFTTQGICPCAGERPDPVDPAQVRLTTLVHNAGCASKIAPADLDAVLTRLPAVTDPAVLSGLAAGDDAAIYRIADNLCLVQTVDVFTPCVDDPESFGRICAANCLSDVYAMGGQPRTALSILGFPSDTLSGEIMHRMLAGAMTTLGAAGVALIGGHSIKDDEIKLGFAITGLIDPAVAAALERPQVGDLLVLTKPLGTGVLTFARQIGRCRPQDFAAAEASMAQLNRDAAEAMKEAGASACTDVTGFGLFGHLIRMLRQARLTAHIWADALPALPAALEALRQGVIPGAVERNREYVGEDLTLEHTADEAALHLGFDAQTSGGLLLAVSPTRLPQLQAAFGRRNVTGTVIGRITENSNGRIFLAASAASADTTPSSPPLVPQPRAAAPTPPAAPAAETDSHAGCCADIFAATPPPAGPADTVAESRRAFGTLMRSIQTGGALPEKTRELILFSLVVLARCAPCFDDHYRRARAMGLTQAELDEAAWSAIAMGGAPVRLFYEECLERARADRK